MDIDENKYIETGREMDRRQRMLLFHLNLPPKRSRDAMTHSLRLSPRFSVPCSSIVIQDFSSSSSLLLVVLNARSHDGRSMFLIYFLKSVKTVFCVVNAQWILKAWKQNKVI